MPVTDYPTSKQWFERARQTLAAGVSSQFRAAKPHPMFYERAEGPFIWDVDGNRYLDYALSQGPMILGHSHPDVLAGISRAMECGQLFAGQHEAEVELAEALVRLIPSAERVRFSSTGSEANHAVIRMARHRTGRRKVIKFEGHYHGWLDNISWSVNPPAEAAGPPNEPEPVPWSGGIPEGAADDLVILRWNDLSAVEAAFERHSGEIAAVITEPIMCNQGCIEPDPGYLEGLRAPCDRHGAALIFDEIITGFRMDLGGAQAHYQVVPDLAVFGKALGSGLPISALVGGGEWFEGIEKNEVFHAGTLNSNNICIAAAVATLDVLERDDRAAHREIVRLGKRLRDGLRELGERSSLPLVVQGPGPMFHAGFLPNGGEVRSYRDVWGYDTAAYQRFAGGMAARGVRLIGRGLWYVSAAHDEALVDSTIETAADVLREMEAEA
jgi:glutamate-1-semialdehyde 2,1-aminomutase